MTTLLLCYCIIHNFLITQEIEKKETVRITFLSTCDLNCDYADNEEELETAGGTTV